MPNPKTVSPLLHVVFGVYEGLPDTPSIWTTEAEARAEFERLCRASGLDPEHPGDDDNEIYWFEVPFAVSNFLPAGSVGRKAQAEAQGG